MILKSIGRRKHIGINTYTYYPLFGICFIQYLGTYVIYIHMLQYIQY